MLDMKDYAEMKTPWASMLRPWTHDTQSALIEPSPVNPVPVKEQIRLVTAILLGSHARNGPAALIDRRFLRLWHKGMADGTIARSTVDQITERYHTLLGSQVAGPCCSMTGGDAEQRAWGSR